MKTVPIVLLLWLLSGCASIGINEPDAVVAAPVNDFVRALTYADLDSLDRSFAPDATLFMPFDESPRRIEGNKAIRETFAPYFAELRKSGRKPPYFDLKPRDLSIQRVGEGLAIVTFHLGELPAAGVTEPVRFSRRTFVVKRYETGWHIVHLHASNVTVSAR